MIAFVWNKVTELGISKDHPDENWLIRLYNRMSFLTCIFIVVAILAFQYIACSPIHVFASFLILLYYVAVLVLNHIGKYLSARYLISIGTPIWLAVIHLLFGGFFCQGAGIICCGMVTYVAFQGRIKQRNRLIAMSVILFGFALVWVSLFGPYFEDTHIPFDEMILFIGSVGWAAVAVLAFDRERAKLMKELKSNHEELVKATEELERFTYIASHDLKSPLRTIISFIGLIERDVKRGQTEEILEKLKFVKTGASQMNFLVQDILELSRLKNIANSERTLIDLNLILKKTQINLMEDMRLKNAIITLYGELPHFIGNELEFLMLFQNFIQNGIKYNESIQPEVIIRSTIREGSVDISFQDNGIGIEEAYYEQIFQFFKRLHNSNRYPGTGLGLGLCSKIITSYQGKVAVQSTVGKGTTFTISLPFDKVPEAENRDLALEGAMDIGDPALQITNKMS